MKQTERILRVSLGLIFLVFGLNGFYTFIPVPEFHPFMSILVSSGYIYFIKVVEALGGILLLSNRFVPLGLAIMSPDVVNIMLYHLLLDHRNWFIAPVLAALFCYLLWFYRANYKCLFVQKAMIPGKTID